MYHLTSNYLVYKMNNVPLHIRSFTPLLQNISSLPLKARLFQKTKGSIFPSQRTFMMTTQLSFTSKEGMGVKGVRKFAPLGKEEGGQMGLAEEGGERVRRLRGVIFDVDGTLW